MTEIRDRHLRFTPEEMTVFLNSLHGLNLPTEQITALESRTEGWVAGVQLAALSLQGFSAERTADFISAFSGSHHYILDYLFEEVLSRQPDEVRDFLLQTSILERMCAGLCDTILTGGARGPSCIGEGAMASPSQEVLEYLERSNLFLVPLDDERCWYRYHHLLVDVLRQILKVTLRPDQIVGLHGRACDWYRQNGLVADAVHHALQAGDHNRAVELVEENAWSMVLRGDLGTLKKWILALPGDSIATRSWLRIHYAWALVFGESEAAEVQLQAVEQQQAGKKTALPAEMLGHITAVRAWIAYEKGEPDRAVVFSRRALELCPQMDPAISSGLMALVGVGCRTQGDLKGAAYAFTGALELAQASGNILMEVAARTSLGELSRMMGRLHEAEAICREALQRAILLQSPVAAQAYHELAIVHREWNELASARLLAERAVESYRAWGFLDALVHAYLFLAGVLQAQNRLPEADYALAQGFQVIHAHALEPRLVPNLGAARARLWVAQGKLEDARRWADTRGLSPEGRFDLRNEIEYLTLVRILLAEGRTDEATRLLSRLQNPMESAGRHGNLIEVLVLHAAALDMQGDTPSALAVLGRAVSLAHLEGYMRVFLDGGKPIEALLRTAITRWKDHDILAYTRKLLAAFTDENPPPTARQASQPGSLSERELDVLRLMAAGCSDREIADELVIAVGTAKRHAANIFDKLDVRNRTEAVTKARQLGLL
jgi:LuxR family maltose regulon positive regulatory protein